MLAVALFTGPSDQLMAGVWLTVPPAYSQSCDKKMKQNVYKALPLHGSYYKPLRLDYLHFLLAQNCLETCSSLTCLCRTMTCRDLKIIAHYMHVRPRVQCARPSHRRTLRSLCRHIMLGESSGHYFQVWRAPPKFVSLGTRLVYERVRGNTC